MHICTGLRTDRKENNYPYLTKKERKFCLCYDQRTKKGRKEFYG